MKPVLSHKYVFHSFTSRWPSTDAGLRSMILYTVLQSMNNAECLSQFPSAMLSSVHYFTLSTSHNALPVSRVTLSSAEPFQSTLKQPWEQWHRGWYSEGFGEMGKGDVKTSVSWHQYCITIVSSVSNWVWSPIAQRTVGLLLHIPPRSNTVTFLFYYFFFSKLWHSKTDLSVYLAVFTCRMTKSVLGGYLMGSGNVVHALECWMLKVMCVALPWCQLSWTSSEYICFPVKASKLMQM